MTLLYHTYEREPCGGLHCVATGQRLLIREVGDERVRFLYRDAEISLDLHFDLQHDGNAYGRTALFDWGQDAAVSLRADYGAWRRLTWFLLDAILVWLIETKRPQQYVLVRGGWFNGDWLRQGRFQVGWFDGGTYRARLLEEVRPYSPFPLQSPAPRWRFEPGKSGPHEGRISAVDTGDDGLPLADLAIPVSEQLAHVPRFCSDHGNLLFFHRVKPHSGPEYSPTMDHGMVGGDYAFYCSQGHGSLVGKPIRLKPRAVPEQAVMREASPDYMKRWAADRKSDRFRLHPALREELFFAGAEAYSLFFAKRYEDFPIVESVEHGQQMRFGYALGQISEPPISVGLPATRLRSWPRLSSEPDERVRGRLSRREEEKRARDRTAFFERLMRRLEGEAP